MESKVSKKFKIHGQFGQDGHGQVFVQGYVNVKWSDQNWYPMNYFMCTLNKNGIVGTFGNNEANVTCKEGGYSHGTYVETDVSSWSFPQMDYVEVFCKGSELRLADCQNQLHKNVDHYECDIAVKCYL